MLNSIIVECSIFECVKILLLAIIFMLDSYAANAVHGFKSNR